MFKDKVVLVTGSCGMIGNELLDLLREKGAIIKKADLCMGIDLRSYENCLNVCDNVDYVFHLAGIKGNPKMTKEKPVDFMGPMLQFDTNMILAAQVKGVKRFLYTSSIAVENPETDYYPAWAKSTAENLINAMRVQYPEGTEYCIVRPANVYGKYDNFDNPNAMVVTKLIKQAMDNKKLVMDKKGSEQIRDFINAKDVAKGMIKAMEDMPKIRVSLCSGEGNTIKEVAEEIAKNLEITIEYKDLDLVLGPDKKVMQFPYIEPEIKLSEGIEEVIDYVNRL